MAEAEFRDLDDNEEITCPACGGQSFPKNEYCALCAGCEFMTMGYLRRVFGDDRAIELLTEAEGPIIPPHLDQCPRCRKIKPITDNLCHDCQAQADKQSRLMDTIKMDTASRSGSQERRVRNETRS